MYNDLEYEQLYERLCVGCPSAKRCHESCENCDEFEEELYKIEFEIEEED